MHAAALPSSSRDDSDDLSVSTSCSNSRTRGLSSTIAAGDCCGFCKEHAGVSASDAATAAMDLES